MATVKCLTPPEGGFSFENYTRNAFLEKKGLALPKAVKTGTTIAGLVYEDGVILGADTRATEGMIVADKNCEKIHYIAPNIYCCGAGTAADTEMTTQMIASNLALHRLDTSRTTRVATANRMLKQYLFQYQDAGMGLVPPLYANPIAPTSSRAALDVIFQVGYVSAALVLGGVDHSGPHLYSIHPHGSTDKLPYVTMGSGSLAAMATFEARYKPNMKKDEAMLLVRDAIAAGIFNDLGSGSNVDLCVINKDNKVEYLRPYDVANQKGVRQGKYQYKPGTTPVISTTVRPVKFDIVSETVHEQMDTS